MSPRSVVFAPHVVQSDHLGRLQHADLVLDTGPFGAHTTASDALWTGLPIVTRPGDTFPSRVAGSLQHAVLPESIAVDEEDYFAVAATLAADAGLLAACKAKLHGNRLSTPLFDVAAYTAAPERLFGLMWERHCSGGHVHSAIWA